MARKKSKGSKKSRAKKSRGKKSRGRKSAAREARAGKPGTPSDIEAAGPETPSEALSTDDGTPPDQARDDLTADGTGDDPTGDQAVDAATAAHPGETVANEGLPQEGESLDAEVIDLDDEPADIEALIAAAAVAGAPVPDGPIEPPTEAPIDPAIETPDTDSGEEPTASGDDEPRRADTEDGGSTAPAASGTPEDAPLIGAEALLALTEIQAEGLASLPAELVFDLGEASTPEDRDRLLAAALAHAEMQEAIYRVPGEERRSRRIKTGIASTILLAAALLAVRPPGFLVPTPPPTLTAGQRETGVRVALTLQAQQVEAFRARNGRLPVSIAEVATAIPGVRYVRSSNRLYQLIAYGADGQRVVYDSALPSSDFERLWRSWSTTADPTAGGLR